MTDMQAVVREQMADLARRRREAQERGQAMPTPSDDGRLTGALVHTQSGVVVTYVTGMAADAVPEGAHIDEQTDVKPGETVKP